MYARSLGGGGRLWVGGWLVDCGRATKFVQQVKTIDASSVAVRQHFKNLILLLTLCEYFS